MLLKNNKGFTVIELIMSFLFASILSLSLFSAVLVYREKQIDSSIEKELLAFKSKLMIDIENDIQLKGVKNIEVNPTYCPETSIEGSPILNSKCVLITFNDNSTKVFKITSEVKQDVIESKDSSETFEYEVLYVVYGDIKYEIPDGANVYIDDNYILSKTNEYDSIEGNLALYRIEFNLKHNNLDSDINISIVASGTKTNTSPAPYKSYNVGDDVTVLVNKSEQLNYKVIEKSDGFKDSVTLLYNGDYDSTLVLNNVNYNYLENLGNRYKNSIIKDKLDIVSSEWNNIDSIRLITVDDIVRISSFCPQYKGVDSSDINLSSSPEWLTNKNYWTMSEKLTSNETNGKKVWVVNGDNKVLTSDFVNSNYALRPVIEIKKIYIIN